MNLAQTGAEAGAEVMYFKKIVNFAKDAINTIAPALSSMNKFGASTAGIVNVTQPVPNPAPNHTPPHNSHKHKGLHTDKNKIGNRVMKPSSISKHKNNSTTAVNADQKKIADR